MGQEIVYCFKCQNRLLGSDFEHGKAFRVDGKAACLDCVRGLLAHLPDPNAELERLRRAQVPKAPGHSTSTRIPAIRPDSTTRIPTQQIRVPPADPPTPPKSHLPLILAGIGGLLLVLILAVTMSSGGRKPVPPPEPYVTVPGPRPPDPGPRPPPRPGPAERMARELEELDARTSLLFRQEKLQEVARLLTSARATHDGPDWQRGIDERMQKVDAAARRLAEPLLVQVADAARKGDTAALNDLKNRIGVFGLPALVGDFDKAVASVAADPWIALDLENLVSDGGAALTKREDRSILASGPNPPKDTFKATAKVGLKQVRAFRLEALSDPSLPAGGPGRAFNGNIVLSEFKVVADGRPLAFSGASAEFEQDKFPSSAAVDGNPLTGWALSGHLGQATAAIFHLQAPVDIETLSVTLEHQTIHTQHVLGCFRLSASVIDLPAPPPPRFAEASQVTAAPIETPPAVLAYREKWAGVARLAVSRNLPAAIKSLEELRAGLSDEPLKKEADADLVDLKLAADALAEVPKLLSRWAKGTKIKLEFIGENGSTELLEGSVLDASARGVTVQADSGVLDVPAGEIGAGSIAALVALRGEKRPTDARASAVLGALEGRATPDVPKRFEAAKEMTDPAEVEARRIFWGAEDEFAAMRTRGASGATYAALLQKATAFAARNKAFLEDRIAATRDLFFFSDELTSGGTFGAGASSKVDSYWISTADSPPGKAAGNFLETEILVQPNATYRAWIYAGGCCQEVFTFFLQGTGLSGPSARNPKETVTAEPGSEDWISVKPPSITLKKKHSDHNGPKEPDRWIWMDLGALKFADAGAKKIRILTEQKGFSVAYLAISAVRQAQPRDVEVKDLVKSRPPADFGPSGTILREIWRGIPGDAVANLTGSPKFKEKPDLSGPITHMDSWNMGNDYGCRIRGYVHPPATGEYVFWIASDDHGELWLSTDDTPAKKQKICLVGKAVGQRNWNADPSQKSNGIQLVAGKRYYIEALQKQGGGAEHVAVGWQLPNGEQERPIPPSRLSAWGSLPSRKVPRPSFRPASPEGAAAKTDSVGGKGGTAFEEVPSPRQFLRGFKYSVSTSGCLRTLQGLYVGVSGESEGARHGGGTGGSEIVARPGYAVGGMVARGTDRLNAFKLVFMRVSGARLIASDRYESGWIGTRGGGAEVTMGGDGTPVLGYFGQAGGEIDAGGLILLGK